MDARSQLQLIHQGFKTWPFGPVTGDPASAFQNDNFDESMLAAGAGDTEGYEDEDGRHDEGYDYEDSCDEDDDGYDGSNDS